MITAYFITFFATLTIVLVLNRTNFRRALINIIFSGITFIMFGYVIWYLTKIPLIWLHSALFWVTTIMANLVGVIILQLTYYKPKEKELGPQFRALYTKLSSLESE